MSYILRLDDLSGSIAEVAHSQLQDAIHQLEEGHHQDPVTAVHEARKDIKKLRALLRLVRPAMKPKDYRNENAALRDAARTISGSRDADVMVAVADDLAERYVGRLPEAAFAQLHDALRVRAEAARGAIEVSVGPALEALRAADGRVESWVPARVGPADLVAGALRAYAEGNDHLARVRKAGSKVTVAELHEWRKRVKDLWYHERLLASVWPVVCEVAARETKVLSEHLGDDHDLAVLADLLVLHDGPAATLRADLGELDELIAHRRGELQAHAISLGRRIYAERPRAFARRWRTLLVLARREQRALARSEPDVPTEIQG
jgi:CHAD domain-containing protein